jgi:hypothetical protein
MFSSMHFISIKTIRGIFTTIEYRLFRCSWHYVSAFFWFAFSLKRTSTQNAWWAVEPTIPQIRIIWDHHPLQNKFKAASQLHRLHPHLMLVISTKECNILLI